MILNALAGTATDYAPVLPLDWILFLDLPAAEADGCSVLSLNFSSLQGLCLGLPFRQSFPVKRCFQTVLVRKPLAPKA
jgi:hypothetical protein